MFLKKSKNIFLSLLLVLFLQLPLFSEQCYTVTETQLQTIEKNVETLTKDLEETNRQNKALEKQLQKSVVINKVRMTVSFGCGFATGAGLCILVYKLSK